MKTIKLFGLALKGNNFDYKTLSTLGLKTGYLVDKECSTKEVYDFLMSININTNTTFYKNWTDILSKSRFELWIDQVFHYMSTYGTNFQGKPFIVNPEFGKEVENINFKEYKIIKSATKEDILKKCNGLISSGIALSTETINDLFSIYERFNYLPDIEIIKNKEVKMQVYFQRNILPSQPEEFLRYLVFLCTKKALLIKDRGTINSIKSNSIDITSYVNKFGIVKLASIFYRFKPLFLAFKENDKNSAIINKLRKLAVKNHKKYTFSFFENILNDLSKVKELPAKLVELNNFKKVSLIEAIRNRLSPQSHSSYIVRNGKMFIKDEKHAPLTKDKVAIYKLMESLVYGSLVKHIQSKYAGKSFYIPSYLDIKLPKSEKTFIGNLPFGSEIKLPENDAIVGVHRRGDEGTDDFDLHFLDTTGGHIGWNSNFSNKDQSIVFSGDMTTANPEATELIYFGRNIINGILTVNRFRGEENSLFTLLIAKENIDAKLFHNYMIKKENILFQNKMTSTTAQQVLGIKTQNSFILQNIFLSNKRVSQSENVTTAYTNYVLENQKNLLSLEKLLTDAGLVKIDENTRKGIIDGSIQRKIDFDFTDTKKDDVINLLAK